MITPFTCPLVPDWVWSPYFPEGDETGLTRLAELWEKQATESASDAKSINATFSTLNTNSYSGDAGDAVHHSSQQLARWISTTGESCRSLSTVCRMASASITVSKLAINTVLYNLAIKSQSITAVPASDAATAEADKGKLRQLQLEAQRDIRHIHQRLIKTLQHTTTSRVEIYPRLPERDQGPFLAPDKSLTASTVTGADKQANVSPQSARGSESPTAPLSVQLQALNLTPTQHDQLKGYLAEANKYGIHPERAMAALTNAQGNLDITPVVGKASTAADILTGTATNIVGDVSHALLGGVGQTDAMTSGILPPTDTSTNAPGFPSMTGKVGTSAAELTTYAPSPVIGSSLRGEPTGSALGSIVPPPPVPPYAQSADSSPARSQATQNSSDNGYHSQFPAQVIEVQQQPDQGVHPTQPPPQTAQSMPPACDRSDVRPLEQAHITQLPSDFSHRPGTVAAEDFHTPRLPSTTSDLPSTVSIPPMAHTSHQQQNQQQVVTGSQPITPSSLGQPGGVPHAGGLRSVLPSQISQINVGGSPTQAVGPGSIGYGNQISHSPADIKISQTTTTTQSLTPTQSPEARRDHAIGGSEARDPDTVSRAEEGLTIITPPVAGAMLGTASLSLAFIEPQDMRGGYQRLSLSATGVPLLSQFGPEDEPYAAMPLGMGIAYQHVLLPGETQAIMAGQVQTVRGLVYRLDEVAHLATPVDLIAALGLGFAIHSANGEMLAYPSEPETLDVLRFTGVRDEDLVTPIEPGATLKSMTAPAMIRDHARPWQGSGQAPGSTSAQPIEEFEILGTRSFAIPHLAEIWRLSADGSQQLVTTYSARTGKWSGAAGEHFRSEGVRVSNGLYARLTDGRTFECVAASDEETVLVTRRPVETGAALPFVAHADGSLRCVVRNELVAHLNHVTSLAQWHGTTVHVLQRTERFALIDFAGSTRAEAVACGFVQLGQGQWQPVWVEASQLSEIAETHQVIELARTLG